MSKRLVIYCIVSLLFGLFLLIVSIWRAPDTFPVSSMYSISDGSNLTSIAKDLKDEGIIKSSFWFKVFSVLSAGPKGLKAGDYVLAEKENVVILAQRMNKGHFDLTLVRITIHEGLNVYEISELLAKKFPKITASDFVELAKADEGYLFPDTYFFYPNITTKDAIKEMKENFTEKTKSLVGGLNESDKDFSDIIKMASIIELEARTVESRKMVSGILWKRLSLGIPLQVDVSFKYINGKNTQTLTLEDLKIDSPYNSYLYKGLPPTPISNPSLRAIEAAINPTNSDYLYFLTGSDGKMYYASSYDKHLQNKRLYLE